ncbi:MAG: type II toxin-antitoxin system Phd/YefM family antitoxin [Alphaproteobacteria bacterium]
MSDDEITISVSEFKARCLKLFDALQKRKLSKIVVTRHGKPVGELVPPRLKLKPLHGALRGTVTVAPGADLTQPTLAEDELDAARGILHR